MSDTVNAITAGTIAVIRTRLPYIDRRALSQAWFSALGLPARDAGAHVAKPEAVPESAPRSAASGAARPVAGDAPAVLARAARPPSSPGSVRLEEGAGAPALASCRRNAAARRAPMVATLRYPPVHAAFRLELDGGRVHVVVRREGAVLHVVALCSQRHVERVRRALALAAEHLRLRGEGLAAEVRALTPAGAA